LQEALFFRKPTGDKKAKQVLIFGAGDAGEKTVREMDDNPGLGYRAVGFIDDDRGKQGRSVHGIPVLGGTEVLEGAVEKLGVDEVLIAAPSAPGETIRRVVSACEACQVRFKTLPGIGELIDGRVSIKALRDVSYEDLLGRPAVKIKHPLVRKYLHNQVVVITGAGGSIGMELCMQVARFLPRRIILVDSSEPNLYRIQMRLEQSMSYVDYVPVLSLVQNRRDMDQIMRQYRPHVVFHAAAYKHVPMLERNPWQAIRNNIEGTQTIMELAVEHGVDRFILVSTDKAVRPSNVMGASKRVCERLMQTYAGDTTLLMAVRFGNVVGSEGSVVPLFQQQIQEGGPVTVTHPEMTRFFMTIPEASQLILQAGALGKGAEIFILEMGTPVKIADMARDLIRLSGKKPGQDIEIRFTKMRPGEKLYEELISEGEGIVQTEHEKILVLRAHGAERRGQSAEGSDASMWNGYGDQEGYRTWLMDQLKELYALAEKYDGCAIKRKLKEIVPEYEIAPFLNLCLKSWIELHYMVW
jgi:FlaA1/EpsC-like NDP-sugar epimerase